MLSVDVSGREMKRHHPRNAGVPRECACLRGGEMAPFGGKLSVLVQKCRLDEKLIGVACQLDNSCNIRGVESGVDHVSNPMSTRGAQCMLLEFAEGNGQIVADKNPAVVWRPAPNRSPCFVQPGTDRK